MYLAYITVDTRKQAALLHYLLTEQGQNETIDQFNVRLCKLAETCDIHDIDKGIHAQIVLK